MKLGHLFLFLGCFSISICNAQTSQNEAIITESIDKLEEELGQISEDLDKYQEEIFEELKQADIPFLDAEELEKYLKEKILNKENKEKIEDSIESGIELMRTLDFQKVFDKMEELIEEIDSTMDQSKTSDKKDLRTTTVKV